ncbi:MAG TPA: zinc ribbon domain-containing protein [Phycisphaerae bacterium]|nr:zinc ribbon domain-containing protein [Phycisphaerae bacterium]
MPQQPSIRRCPNCGAVVPKTATNCVSCKMDVARMDTFKAARGAATRRGIITTEVQSAAPPFWRSPGLIAALVVLLCIGGFIAWRLTRPAPPPPWARFPTSQDTLVDQMFHDIAVGDDPGYDKAYALLSPAAHNPDDADELGHYRQLYHEIFKYLNNFDSTWVQNMKIEHDPDNPDTMLVHVGPETLHVTTRLETPADKVNDTNKHYAVGNIAEYDVSDAAAMSSTEAQKAVIRSMAGQGAINNIEAISGAGGHAHETPMQAKMRLIPLYLDPRHVNNYEIYHAWPLRKDPAVRWALERMTQDQRYVPEAQGIAKEVLDEKVSEEELIAAGVEGN